MKAEFYNLKYRKTQSSNYCLSTFGFNTIHLSQLMRGSWTKQVLPINVLELCIESGIILEKREDSYMEKIIFNMNG